MKNSMENAGTNTCFCVEKHGETKGKNAQAGIDWLMNDCTYEISVEMKLSIDQTIHL